MGKDTVTITEGQPIIVTFANPIQGTAGTSGTCGTSGTSGTSGSSGSSGTHGTSGTSGSSGSSGTSGTDGSHGTSGTSGSGTSGTSGTTGTSGTSGSSSTGTGTSGTSGTSGSSSSAGSHGTSGTSGSAGTHGTSGTSGSTGSGGTSGSSGTHGTSGTSGTSGSSGSTGTSGTSASAGTSGTSGSSGTDSLDSHLAAPDPHPQYLLNDEVINQVASGTYITGGGTVTWVSGLTFRIGAATYLIEGVQYSSVEGEITLDTADRSNPRIDVIAFTTTGTLAKITGAPLETPALPDVDPTAYCMVTFATIPANATIPDNADVIPLYTEGAEWTFAASAGTIVKDSTNNPRTGSKCIEGTNVAANSYFTLTKAAPFDPGAQTALIFYIRKKAAWATTKRIAMRWYNGATAKGAAVTISNGVYGINYTSYGEYEQIVVPMSAFIIPVGTLVDVIRFTFSGSGTVGFYLDDIYTQSGLVTVATSSTVAWKGTWGTAGAYSKNDIVNRNSDLYIALQANVNFAPESNVALWAQMADISSGTSGTSGSTGSNGTSGSSGTHGTSGTSGTAGTSGTSGTSGSDLQSMVWAIVFGG